MSAISRVVCDVCSASHSTVQHAGQVPYGWVRRVVVDRSTEHESGAEFFDLCPVCIERTPCYPPLHPQVKERAAQLLADMVKRSWGEAPIGEQAVIREAPATPASEPS
jgi:hypothetical protein